MFSVGTRNRHGTKNQLGRWSNFVLRYSVKCIEYKVIILHILSILYILYTLCNIYIYIVHTVQCIVYILYILYISDILYISYILHILYIRYSSYCTVNTVHTVPYYVHTVQHSKVKRDSRFCQNKLLGLSTYHTIASACDSPRQDV